MADAKGPKKNVKHQAADNALKCLSKLCHTVVMSGGGGGVDRGAVVSRREIQGQAQQSREEPRDKLDSSNIGQQRVEYPS